MIKTKKHGSIIVISGPSGAGKDTIANIIIKEMSNVKLSISYTTRTKREIEENGKDYFFITEEEFKKGINNNEFLEYAIYCGNYYGTSKKQVETLINKGHDVILVIEVEGAKIIKETIKDSIFIFIMPPTLEELKNRLVNRNTDTKEEIINRLKTAYKEIGQYKNYDYIVVNDNIDNAIEKVKSIIVSEKCRVDRIIDLDLEI